MRRIFLSIVVLLVASSVVFSQKHSTKNKIKNGLYLINKLETDEDQYSQLTMKEASVRLSKYFVDKCSDDCLRIIIDKSDFVPLDLDRLPFISQQTEENKKLLLFLTKESSERMKKFTETHVMGQVAVVVGGEVISMFRLKRKITNAQLQITGCSDVVCEKLYAKLKKSTNKLRHT